MEKIPLPSLERLREKLTYDPLTGVLTWKTGEKVSAKMAGKVAGCLNQRGYRQINFDGTDYKAHRLAWAMSGGEDPCNLEIDHINGDRDDNRIANLRVVTPSENQHNRRNARGYTFHKQARKWQARIWLNGKQHFLGMHKTEEEARDAYLAAKARLHPTSPITK